MSKSLLKRRIDFEPIQQGAAGHVALSIYPPDTFMAGSPAANEHFSVFVGGSGNGERKTLEQAKKFLLERAITYCDQRIADATHTIEHYRRERQKLLDQGLVQK